MEKYKLLFSLLSLTIYLIPTCVVAGMGQRSGTGTTDQGDSFNERNRGREGPLVSCPTKTEVTSLNMAFDYSSTDISIPGVFNDLKIFDKFASTISNKSKSRSWVIGPNQNKTIFLNQLRSFANSNKYLNLNIAAHGFELDGVGSFLVLPGYSNCMLQNGIRIRFANSRGITQERFNKTNGIFELVRTSERSSGNTDISTACMDYLVSGKDMQAAVKNSDHVFGFLTTCRSGNIAKDLAQGSDGKIAVIAASQPGKDIIDAAPNGLGASELAGKIDRIVTNPISCEENNKGGEVSFADLPQIFGNFKFDQPSGRNVKDVVNSCFVIQKRQDNCRKANSTKDQIFQQ